jgi:hypothetical protein
MNRRRDDRASGTLELHAAATRVRVAHRALWAHGRMALHAVGDGPRKVGPYSTVTLPGCWGPLHGGP